MSKNEGFTLIELLIVLVIISIVGAFAILSVGTNTDKNIESLAKEISERISLAEEEALLRPAVLGLAFSPNAFQFFIFEETQTKKKSWSAVSDLPLKLHSFSNSIQLTLKIADKIVSLDGKPKIIISGSDITPFTIYLGKKESTPRYEIIGESNGNLSVKPYDEK